MKRLLIWWRRRKKRRQFARLDPRYQRLFRSLGMGPDDDEF